METETAEGDRGRRWLVDYLSNSCSGAIRQQLHFVTGGGGGGRVRSVLHYRVPDYRSHVVQVGRWCSRVQHSGSAWWRCGGCVCQVAVVRQVGRR